MGNGITDLLESNRALATGMSSVLASETLTNLAKGAANAGKTVKAGAFTFGSLVVDPAIWLYNGSGPGAADVAIWLFGAAATLTKSTIGSPAGIAANIAKAAIDNINNKKLQEAMRGEPFEKAPYMDLCTNYPFWSNGAMIDAMAIAEAGGVAWQHTNGYWVYMKDASGRLVCDYEPKIYTKVFCPVLPLEPNGKGGFRWTTY